jgi:hypothetical protein
MQGPLLTPLYPERDQVLTQLPNYIEVAIDYRDTQGNASAPQLYVDGKPIHTTLTPNSTMKGWITWTLKTGKHTGKATLDWTSGKMIVTWSFTVEVFVGPGDELMVRHQYEDEFSLLVPQGMNWSLEEDSDISGEVFPLVMYGPTFSSFRTNIIVSSQRDSAVEETEAYLDDQLDQAIDELSQSGINAIAVITPELRKVDNHTALVATIQLEGYSVYQKIAIIASEEHEMLWAIIFSISMSHYSAYNDMFENMIDGFEIDMKPISPAENLGQAAIGLGIAALAGGTAGAVVWFTRRRREPLSPK